MKKIIKGVLAAHGFILLVLIAQHWLSYKPVKRKAVAVNTVRIVPPPVAVSAPVVKKMTAPPKSVPPAVKASPVAKATKPVSKKEVAAPVAAAPKPDLHIPTVERAALQVPTLSRELPVLGPIVEESATERLAVFLREVLQLPELGAVKMELTIDRFGQLLGLEVLEAHSEKNAAFLKNQLPELRFPCLNETVSLTIVFSNEI